MQWFSLLDIVADAQLSTNTSVESVSKWVILADIVASTVFIMVSMHKSLVNLVVYFGREILGEAYRTGGGGFHGSAVGIFMTRSWSAFIHVVAIEVALFIYFSIQR